MSKSGAERVGAPTRLAPPTYRALGVFGFRAAALPTSTLHDWLDAGDPGVLPSWLVEQFDHPYLSEALWLASPRLAERWSQFRRDGDAKPDADWLATLTKYLSRACCRSTPFGLFAGVSAGNIEDRTQLLLKDRHQWIRRVRLDHAFLLDEADRAIAACRTEPWMRYVVNSTLCRMGNRVRYFVPAGSGDVHHYRHVEVELSEPLAQVLRCCGEPCTSSDLLDRLRESFPDAHRDDLEGFVQSLAARGILVSAYAPRLTSESALSDFLDRFPNHAAASNLIRIRQVVDGIDGSRTGDTAYSVAAAADTISQFTGEPMPLRLFQVDTEITPKTLTLSESDVVAVSDALDALSILSMDETPDVMGAPVRRFVDRWGDALVPLSLVADDDAGILFGDSGSDSPDFLRRLDLRTHPARQKKLPSAGEQWLVRRVIQTIESRKSELVIAASDVASLRGKTMSSTSRSSA